MYEYHIIELIDRVLANQEKIMSGLSDLQTAISALQAAVNSLLTNYQNLDSDASVEAAAQQVNTITAQINNVLNPPATSTVQGSSVKT